MLNSPSADRNDALATLLVTATVAFDTDRHVARRCMQRAVALLGIDLSSPGDGDAEQVRTSSLCATVTSTTGSMPASAGSCITQDFRAGCAEGPWKRFLLLALRPGTG